MAENDEDIEIIDLSALRKNEGYIKQILGDVTKQSAARQVAIGGAAGWFSGYLFVKVGKLAACSIGTTLLFIQIAQHQGYIEINWNRVNKQVENAKRVVKKEAKRHYPHLANNVQRFIQENMFLAGSFAGGFFLGLTF